MDSPVETGTPSPEAQCTTCVQHNEEQEKSAETSFAFLLSLLPVLAMTFFGQIGLL